MAKKPIEVRVEVDAKIFRDFALFDNLRRRRRWISPALFAAILLAFSCVCFALRSRAEQAGLLGGVLLAVGLGLPAVYFLSFFLSVRAQIQKLGLSKPQKAYTLLCDGSGVTVSTDREQARYPWDRMYAAYRVEGAVYLYAAANRAFLLPDRQIEGGPEELWGLIRASLPERQTFDRRSKRARNL